MVLIQKVKNFKMASKMAISWHPRWPSVGIQDGRQLASKDLFDHKNNLDIKHFNFDFIWMFVDLILQLIKLRIGLI